MTALTDILGPPDFDRTGGPDECLFMVEQTRAVGWNSLGLRVLLTDWGGDDQPASPMHLATWDAAPWDGVTNDPRITTKEGLGVGSTSVRLRAIYPDAMLTIAEATMWFVVERATGRIRGAFDWAIMPMGELGPEFFRPLQAALNAHGADLVVDGLFGPRTAQALTAFATSHGIEDEIVDAAGRIVNWDPLLDAAWRLGLPPDDVRVLAMSAGDGGRCE